MVPKGHPAALLRPAEFYRRLHGAVAAIVGVGARMAGEEEVVRGGFCFSAPSRDDLLLDGAKVLGGAIRRSAGSLLYQGSLRLGSRREFDPVLLAECLGEVILGRVLLDEEIHPAGQLSRERYCSAAWNERR
jgi:lipoate-protein ligase A